MKRFIIILICTLSVSFHAYSNDYYYWYQGKQIPLRQGSRFYVIYDAKESKSSLQVIEGGYLSLSKEAQFKWGIVSEQTLANAKNVLYQMPSFVSSDTTQDMFVTHRFYVKLKRQDDIILLNNLVEQYQAEIEQEGDFPLWYIIRCGSCSQYNALSLANIFYESGLFAVAEPEFINAIHLDCVNDPKFSQQWNLKNTGQWFESYSGIDINYCDAHAITSGNASVIIGVYDLGVDLTHPDINLYSFSYDVNTQSSPSTIYTDANGNNYHGTACAGIIGAKTDNSIGIAGIAPDCPIMSISFYNTTTQNIGNAFKVAANQGCSVISNSWHVDASSDYINEGISYALSQGRDGKGCVIVFSAGNENRDSVNYPANSNDSIIVVGAMSPCGERCNPHSCDGETNWGSNYGDKLDIMAPGVLIRTTDNVGFLGATLTDYMTNFNGTSSACPHVAGVAGLILSVNPNLTSKEVTDIIESTARKEGINFNPTPNRPNGTWSFHFGYGLIDAYAAVVEAKYRYEHYIQGPDYVCDTTEYHLIHPSQSGETVAWSVSNGTIPYPHYSIVGPANQDTVRVACEYVNVRGTNEVSDLPNFTKSLSVTIANSSNNTSETYTKKFRMPTGDVPEVSISNTSVIWQSGTTRTFTVTNCTDVPDSMLLWEVKKTVMLSPFNHVTTNYYTGRTLTYTAIGQTRPYPSLKVTVTNTQKDCDPKSISMNYIVLPRKNSLLAYSEGGILHVSVYDAEDPQRSLLQLNDGSEYSLELWHNIYGRMHIQPAYSAKEQMNISGLSQGVYVLIFKENGNIIAETKVQID